MFPRCLGCAFLLHLALDSQWPDPGARRVSTCWGHSRYTEAHRTFRRAGTGTQAGPPSHKNKPWFHAVIRQGDTLCWGFAATRLTLREESSHAQEAEQGSVGFGGGWVPTVSPMASPARKVDVYLPICLLVPSHQRANMPRGRRGCGRVLAVSVSCPVY